MDIVEIEIKQNFEEPLLKHFLASVVNLAEPCVIVLDIESKGGQVIILEAIEAKVKEMKSKDFVFVTNVDNYAYSCGFALFLLGDIKICDEVNAKFMHHSPGIEVNDRLTASDAMEIYQTLNICDELVERMFFENTNISPENYRILKKNDTFLDRTDLINLGIMQNEYKF